MPKLGKKDRTLNLDWSDRSGYDNSRYRQRRAELLRLLGDSCADCGAVDHLEIDHVIPALKSFNISKRWNTPIHELMPELMKCQLLCSSCHEEKTEAQVEAARIPHGGGLSGRKGCKCAPCRQRKSEYSRAYNLSRRRAA